MKRSPSFLAFIALSLGGAVDATGQVTINEACSKNVSVLADGEDHFPDWIELHNPGSIPVYLSGLFLSDDAGQPFKFALPAEMLAPGAFLVLLQGDDNGDGHHFPFKLAQEGEDLVLSTSTAQVLSTLSVPELRADHSFGRSSITGNDALFIAPTPGTANDGEAFVGYTPAPLFNKAPGFHGSGLSVSIQTEANTTVHFTTDGNTPDGNSGSYTQPITIGNTTTLKARAFRAGWVPSTISVATYLIDEATELPVVSLSMPADSMFHPELGLYMLGPEASPDYPFPGANFWDERGIAVHFEYFDEHGQRRVEQELELRIHGGSASRTKPQRPLRLTARDAYGDDRIRYPFFPDRPDHDTFKRLVLRNAGGDWCLAHYRDGFFHQAALHQGLDVDGLGFRSVIVFINGAYYGLYEIRERIDEDHLALTEEDVDSDDLLLMEEENLSIQGDTMPFHDLKEFIYTHDLNDEADYAHVDSLLDVPSFMDYFAVQMFAGNADWPANNLKYWKPSVSEGKWRYLLYDLDATMNVAGWIPNDYDMFHLVLVHRAGWVHSEIYRSLMERAEFRRGFLNRLADLMNTSLSTPVLLAENERIRNGMASEIPRHFPRWGFPTSDWEHHSGELIPLFLEQRQHFMREDVLQWYDLPNCAELRFEVFPPGSGRIRINTIQPGTPFQGVYFNGNDIDITAVPAEGQVFDHWTYTASGTERMDGPHQRRSFASDGTITAWFTRPDEELQLFPSPCSDVLTIGLPGSLTGPLELRIHDVQGRLVQRSTRSIDPGLPSAHLDVTALPPGLFTLTVLQQGLEHRSRFVKVRP